MPTPTEHECGFNAGRADFLDGYGFIPEYWGERSDDWRAGYETAQDKCREELEAAENECCDDYDNNAGFRAR